MPARSARDVARTRAFWLASRPVETGAPAYVLDPPLWWHVGLALGGALLVQSTLAPYLAVRGGTVSLVTLVVAWYGVRTGTLRGAAFGLSAGACEDALAGATGVAWTVATTLAGGAAGRLARTWLADAPVVLVPGVALLVLVRYGVFAFAMHAQAGPFASALAQLHAVLWQALVTALVAWLALLARPGLIRRANRS